MCSHGTCSNAPESIQRYSDAPTCRREPRAGSEFLRTWAADHDLTDTDLRVVTGDVQTRIAEAATDATLLIIDATERGVLSRLVRGSLVLDVLNVNEVECSVVLAEKRHKCTLRERLFGTDPTSTASEAETGVEREPVTPDVENPNEEVG